MKFAALITSSSVGVTALGGGSAWDRIGPWNLFDDPNENGEAGTLDCAASHEKNPNVIYTGGQNNGVSSGILKSVDGGKHWTRNSKGLWDTRILGCWVHPEHEDGSYVFAGTHSGVYESADSAESWTRCDETMGWGMVRSFRSGMINGEHYILANADRAILTRKLSSACGWQKIDAPGGFPANQHLSVIVHDGNTEVLTVVGGWGGGDMYYGNIVNETYAKWTGPVTTSAGEKLSPSNVAIDPKDRNHFLFSKGGEYRTYESKDGGKTAARIESHADKGAFFVMIDSRGWFYTATQEGAFASQDAGVTWNPLHVWMQNRDGTRHDRVPHDFQRIVPDFRGDGVAIPSDQGLHIVDLSTMQNMTNAIGDMKNAMSLSAIISPSKTHPGSRNLVVNAWDWNVVASWNDGATWPSWKDSEANPYWCGEGGGGSGMGASGKVVMMHHSTWGQSSDGGHNWIRANAPGNVQSGAFDYVRLAGSRSEPAGTCFTTGDFPADTPPAPPPGGFSAGNDPSSWGLSKSVGATSFARPVTAFSDSLDKDKVVPRVEAEADGVDEMNPNKVGPEYAAGVQPLKGDNVKFLMTSNDFGVSWNWTAMPANLQASGLVVDPTSKNSLFGITSNCLAHSIDQGLTWSACSTATGLVGHFTTLLVKDSKVMFMVRDGAVPLRTTNGGSTWTELTSAAPLYKYGATFLASLSWSGNTLVLHGVDHSAIGRGEYGTSVWKSCDSGNTWADETGDLVTISPGPGVWYEKDFYLVTSGEGVTVKRNFDCSSESLLI